MYPQIAAAQRQWPELHRVDPYLGQKDQPRPWRYQESLVNVTPAVAYVGRSAAIKRRDRLVRRYTSNTLATINQSSGRQLSFFNETVQRRTPRTEN